MMTCLNPKNNYIKQRSLNCYKSFDMNIKSIFQIISYFQYPLMLISMYFLIRPFFNTIDNLFHDINIALTVFGIATGFSTLQDTTKVQNKVSLRIYQNPKKTKIFLALLLSQISIFLILGLWGLLSETTSPFSDLSFGLISLGIGMIGMLKSASEMAEFQYHLHIKDSQSMSQS